MAGRETGRGIMRLRRLLFLGGLLVAAAGGAWWYATQRPLAVPVAALERDVPIRVFGLGTIEAQVLSRVGFEVIELQTHRWRNELPRRRSLFGWLESQAADAVLTLGARAGSGAGLTAWLRRPVNE